MGYVYNFEKLEVWKQSRAYVVEIYKLSRIFPIEEKFGMSSQIQRAAVSVMLNITEGTSRFSDKEKIRFIEIAYTSLMEILSLLYVALDLEYINNKQFDDFKTKLDKIAIQLTGLVKFYNKRMNSDDKSV